MKLRVPENEDLQLETIEWQATPEQFVKRDLINSELRTLWTQMSDEY